MKRLLKLLRRDRHKGQSLVEFAIVLPVVLLVVFGIIEFGFLIFTYSSVNSASREAARYGIAIGQGTVSGLRYYDCQGIKNAGLRIGRFAGMTDAEINISYDSGPGTSPEYTSCEALVAAINGGNDTIKFGDRIVVTVNHPYRPMISYMGLNLPDFNMSSTSSRTIVKEAIIAQGPGGGGSGGDPPTATPLPTSTPGPTFTPSPTPEPPTETPTPGGPTDTPIPPVPPTDTPEPPTPTPVPEPPPLNPSVTFTWLAVQHRCSAIHFIFEVNPVWATSAVQYRVYRNGNFMTTLAAGSNPIDWNTQTTIGEAVTISFGVEAVFAGPVYSQYLEVRYLCTGGNLVSVGQLVRE